MSAARHAWWLAVALGCGTPSSAPAPGPAVPVSVPGPTTAAPAPDALPTVLADARVDVPPMVLSTSPVDAPPAAGPVIVDAPLAWSDARAALTLDYRRAHSDPAAADLAIAPRVIVLHYTGGSSATGTRRYFDNPRIEASRPALARAGAVNVSAHFVVDRDGTIYQLQPVTRFARHCIGLNHVAIGVENVGDGARWPLTAAQIAADAALVRALARAYPITHLVGHHEVMRMGKHVLFRELDPSYGNDKPDPGPAFMAAVRAQLVDLALGGPTAP